MLTNLQIENFKGWKDTGPLRLAPITVFFGTNSSGKSSIGQLLMMLKQTANSPDRNRVLHPGDDHSPVDLGTLEDIIHQHDTKQVLHFSLQWRCQEPLEVVDILTETSYSSSLISFSTEIALKNGKGVKVISRGFRYQFDGGNLDEPFVVGMKPRTKNNTEEYKLISEVFKAVRKPGRLWPLTKPVRFFGFPDELIAHYKNADVLNDIALDFQNTLQSISYLGPLREEPKRHYPWSGDTPEDVGVRGENWVSAFLAAEDRKISGGNKQRYKSFDVVVASQLQELGLIHSFVVEPIAKGVREYRVGVKVTSRSSQVAVPDVGFGVSQVLPIIVQSFYAEPHSTVIIEQPELHLHPAVQQNLADLFISAIHAKEDGADRKVQFLLESHSEHFLQRLLRRVAEDEISTDDVAIYFCDQSAGRSKIEALNLDEFGNITNWPKDFFGDQMADIAATQKAGIQKRRNAQS